MTDTIAERVARGAALLDERRPWWAGEIDTRHLALWECKHCTLGQPYGNYQRGLDILFGVASSDEEEATREEVAAAHGFNVDDQDDGDEYNDLRLAWIAAIASRLAPEPACEPEPMEAEPCPT